MKRSQVLIILLSFLIVLIFYINRYISFDYSSLIYLIITGISLITSVFILFGNKKTESKIAWVIFVLFVPIVGFLFYVILGIEYNRFKKFDPKFNIDQVINKVLEKNRSNDFKQKSKEHNQLISYIENVGKFPLCTDNKVKVLTNGPVKFNTLKEELKKAQKFIHLEYFIIREGNLLNELTEILIDKARAGVKIRLLYDDFGCVDLSQKYLKCLHQEGIETACFNKIDFRLFRPSINYRNHRKIVIIDNKVGFTGGINIGDEYIHQDSYYGFWRDTHIMIEGTAARELNNIFIKDWYHTTNQILLDSIYTDSYPVKNKDSAVQVISDGPDTDDEFIKDVFFKMITLAKKRIWLTTPYLIPNVELITALRVAALSGVDVRILVPGKHDKGKKLIYHATQAYFSELLDAGVKIYTYSNLFMHSKIMIVDDDLASVGTVNFDYRSFGLHFEDTVILYEDDSIKQLINDFEEDLVVSKQIDFVVWKKRHKIQKMIESVMRIFSPLL